MEQRRYLAGFAYILARVADADLTVSDSEMQVMEKTLVDIGGLPEAQAVLVVEIARSQQELYGGTEDYIVTREWTRNATDEQRHTLLHCAYAIGAADGSIDAPETAVLDEIGRELGFTDQELRPMRAEFHDSMAAVQQMRRALAGTPAANAPIAPPPATEPAETPAPAATAAPSGAPAPSAEDGGSAS
jgi:uncharacterized tellurite resistance protein B-like protein